MGHIDSYKKFAGREAKKIEEDQMMMGQTQSTSPEMQQILQKEANIHTQINQLNLQLEAAAKEKLALIKAETEANKSAALAQQNAEKATASSAQSPVQTPAPTV